MNHPSTSLLSLLACAAALTVLPAAVHAQGSPTGLPSALNVTVKNTPLPVTGTINGQVTVANSLANPVPTRDVNNPARSPYLFSAACESNNSNGCNVTTPPVPAGKRLVLQHVNGSMQLLNAAAQVQAYELFIGNVSLKFAPRLVGSFGGLSNWAVNEPTLMFVEPGGTIIAQASSSEIRLIVQFTLTGYLLDAN